MASVVGWGRWGHLILFRRRRLRFSVWQFCAWRVLGVHLLDHVRLHMHLRHHVLLGHHVLLRHHRLQLRSG